MIELWTVNYEYTFEVLYKKDYDLFCFSVNVIWGSKTGSPSCLTPLAVDGDELEEVDEFVYLVSLVPDTVQNLDTTDCPLRS